LVGVNPGGSVKWVRNSIAESKYWQPSDSFVSVVDNFYLRRGEPGYELGNPKFHTKRNKVRAITFEGFSYEVDVSNGHAEYFDFHK